MKKIIFTLGIISVTLFACKKSVTPTTTYNATIPNTKQKVMQVLEPTGPFTITVKKDGSYTCSDMAYVNSFPQLQAALKNIGTGLSKDAPKTVDLFVENGNIISKFKPFNGKGYFSLLVEQGDFHFFEENTSFVFNENGFESVSHPELFLMFPKFEEKLIEIGEDFKNKVGKSGKFEFELTPQFTVISGGNTYSLTNTDQFKSEYTDCIKHYLHEMWAIVLCRVYILF